MVENNNLNQTNNFSFNFEHVKNHSTKNLRFLETRKKNKPTRYTLIQTSHPKWLRLKFLFKDIIHQEKTRVISHHETLEIIKNFANEIEDSSHPITKSKELRNRAQLFEGIESPEHRERRALALESGKEKFRRTAERAKVIGRGMVQAEKLEHKPLMLHQGYWPEVIHHSADVPYLTSGKILKAPNRLRIGLKLTLLTRKKKRK